MKSQHPLVHLVQPRASVEILLPDGRVYSAPRGTTIGNFLRAMPEWERPPIMGAVVNGELRELTFPIEMDADVKPVTMADDDGARIYRRSLTFVLEAAFEDIYPDFALSVDHSVSSGGYYCEVVGHSPLSHSEVIALDNHMRDLIKSDIPFERMQVPIQKAIAYFKVKKQTDKVRLLKYRQKDYLILYRLGEHQDYHHGYMVPSTGFLKWFALVPTGDGFILQFTRRQKPTELTPLKEAPRLLSTFRQYGSWLVRLGVDSVGALDDVIQAGKIQEIILVSEALQEQKIAEIASQILTRPSRPHIVLIAGPSSSGKTTFSKRLAIQLLAQGISPFPLEIDNYFVDREFTPKGADGKYDFESIGAVDRKMLSDHLKRLVNGEEVQLRHYNFKQGKNEPGEITCLQKDQMLILEGIHGLNPQLLTDIPSREVFRIYVSCLTQLNLDRYNRISTTDTRLVRRIVRDSRERGYTAQDTINRWESVRRGEKLNIFPFQENSDEMFNSALVYELSALKPFVEPLLRQVPYGTMEHVEAKRLLAVLDWFLPLGDAQIPDNSILREFIGGSILRDFKLWEKME
jgi:uridine kinase